MSGTWYGYQMGDVWVSVESDDGKHHIRFGSGNDAHGFRYEHPRLYPVLIRAGRAIEAWKRGDSELYKFFDDTLDYTGPDTDV